MPVALSNSTQPHPEQKFRLRTLCFLFFALQLFTLLSFVGYFALENSQTRLNFISREPPPSLQITAPETSIIQEMIQELQVRGSNSASLEQGQAFDFFIKGERQIAQIFPIENSALNGLVVFTHPVPNLITQITPLVALSFTFILETFIIVFLLTKWIFKPIRSITNALEKVTDLKFEQQIAGSFIFEIRQLVNAFNQMTGHLKNFWETVQKSEATNHALVEAIPDLLLRVNRDGVYLDQAIGAERLKKIFGKSIALTNTSVYDSLPPKAAQQRMDAIHQALESGKLKLYEHQLEIDGRLIDEEVRVVVMGENEVLIMVRDITDRKRAEEALRIAEENYRGIFENALEGLFQSTPEGKLLSANPAMARILGYDSATELMAQIQDFQTQIFTNPVERERFYCLMQEQEQVKNFEFQVSRPDGSIIWAEIDGRVVHDHQGQVRYYEGIIQDITERKRQKEILETMVKERTAQLEKANTEISLLNEKLKSENIHMSAELDILREMQQLILPKADELQSIKDLEIVGFMTPADKVGGDYYDILDTNGIVTIGIGDVTGHGLESGILMVMAQTAVRTLKEMKETDPIRFLDTLNRTIYKNIKRMNSDKNLTLALLNYAKGRISISGQHEEALIVRKGGKIEPINTMDLGLPIGLDEEISEFIHQTSIDLALGDGVVLYTDGITEAKNIKREFYGLQRLCTVISQNWHLSAEEIKQRVIDDLWEFIGGQKVFDDITLVVLKRKAPLALPLFIDGTIAKSEKVVSVIN